jgi:hypothetical protein
METPEYDDDVARPEVRAADEPATDPSDPHEGPLDDDEDARFLRSEDPRRQEVEQRRGERFPDQGDDEQPEADAADDEGEAAEGGADDAEPDAAAEDQGE